MAGGMMDGPMMAYGFGKRQIEGDGLGSLWDSVIEKRKEGGKEGEKKFVWEMDE